MVSVSGYRNFNATEKHLMTGNKSKLLGSCLKEICEWKIGCVTVSMPALTACTLHLKENKASKIWNSKMDFVSENKRANGRPLFAPVLTDIMSARCFGEKRVQSPASSDEELSELEDSDPLLTPRSSSTPALLSVSGKHFLQGWNPLSNS